MAIKDMLPKGFVHWLRIVKLNTIYTGTSIRSPYVEADSIIKPHITIAYGCDVLEDK